MSPAYALIIVIVLILGAVGVNAQTDLSVPAGSIGASTPSLSVRFEQNRVFLQGLEYERRGEFQLAAQSYQEVLSASPDHLEARFRLANVLRAGDPKSTEALEQLRFCVKKKPAHIGYRMALVTALKQAGYTVEAIQHLEVLRKLLPLDPRIRYQLAELYWQKGDARRAGQLLDDLIGRYPRDQASLLLAARISLKRGDPRKAIRLLNQALGANPYNYAALIDHAKASAILGDSTSALSDLEMAVNVNPTDPRGYRLLSEARKMAGDQAGARKALDMAEVFEKLPKEEAQRLYALYYKERRTPAESIYLGSRLAALGRAELAVPLLEEGLRRNRRDLGAWHLLGKLLYEGGDWEGAVRAFEIAEPYMKRRNRLGYYQFMSTALFNSGNLQEASKYVEEGLRSYPKDRVLQELNTRIRMARQPPPPPQMTATQRNRLLDIEKRRRYYERKPHLLHH